MANKTLVVIFCLFSLISVCKSEEKTISAVYTLSINPPSWMPGKDIEYDIKLMPDGRIEHAGQHKGLSKLIFDPNTFSTETVKDGFKFEQEHNKKNTTFSKGDEWKIKYTTPPNQNCNNTGSAEYTAEVTDVGKTLVKIGDKEEEVEKVTVKFNGFWSHCQYNGSSSRTTTFSKKLGLIISSEQISYMNGNIVAGSRMLIKEIRVK